GSFAQFSIDDYASKAALGDLTLGFALGPRLRFAAAAFHFGWVDSFRSKEDVAPMTLQSGLSYRLDLPGILRWTIHTDLRRSTDGPREYLFGLESSYRQVLVLRMGTRFAGSTTPTVHGGVGFNVGPVEVSYGYGSNSDLDGSHTFGLAYQF
ncbi:MAG TPA: hypothetical protein VLM37_02385, partial [Fibrobacteraceae bacterium]|nr:hypothetical protein [Fibrobacteraceae bacterium]